MAELGFVLISNGKKRNYQGENFFSLVFYLPLLQECMIKISMCIYKDKLIYTGIKLISVYMY